MIQIAPMTPEEIAKARAEWDALPGTPSDGRVFIKRSERSEFIGEAAIEKATKTLIEKHGDITWRRLTAVEGGWWLEGWRVRPFKQGPEPTEPPPG